MVARAQGLTAAGRGAARCGPAGPGTEMGYDARHVSMTAYAGDRACRRPCMSAAAYTDGCTADARSGEGADDEPGGLCGGDVDWRDVRDDVAATALEEKISSTYNSTLDSWIEALNPVYHYENLAA